MKTKKHKSGIIAKAAVLLALFLTSTPAATAQEFIMRTPLDKSNSMIIRDVSGNKWLVYNQNPSHGSAFILFTETGVTAQVLQLPDSILLVNDFEIYNNTVYFAGKTLYNAVMGYFDLVGFPSTTVKICSVPIMSSFDKLEVGLSYQVLHVFMTGEEVLGGGHMVDAWDAGGGLWKFSISIYNEEATQFDDVAVLSSKIVFSARKESNHEGFMYYFTTPPAMYSIFPQLTTSKKFGPTVGDKILLDVSSGDNFVYVHRTINNNDVVAFLNGINLTQFHNLGSIFAPCSFKANDLRCGGSTTEVELVSAYTYDVLTANCTTAVFPPPPSLFYGHRFNGENIYSIDAAGLGTDKFVAAGSEINDLLSIYRYKRNAWLDPGCSARMSQEYVAPNYKLTTGERNFQGRDFIINVKEIECTQTYIPVTTKCDENRGEY